MSKKTKRVINIILLMAIVVVLAGCIRYDSTGHPTGWVYNYLGRPTTYLLDWLANIFNNSYGMAIIIVTVITRLIMLPSTLNMTKNSMMTQAKMKFAQPEIEAIQKELKQASTPQEQTRLNLELQQVYKKYDISMMSNMSGCLPLLIQLPFISAVYAAIRSSEQITNSTFLGIKLGERSLIIVILVVIVYALQGWLMTKGTPTSDNPQAEQTQKSMMLMNPIMFAWISYTSAAGLGLYFLIGGIVAVIQQLYTNHIVRPRITKLLEEEASKYENMPRRTTTPPKDVTHSANNQERIVPVKQNIKSQRNAGKQRPRRK